MRKQPGHLDLAAQFVPHTGSASSAVENPLACTFDTASAYPAESGLPHFNPSIAHSEAYSRGRLFQPLESIEARIPWRAVAPTPALSLDDVFLLCRSDCKKRQSARVSTGFTPVQHDGFCRLLLVHGNALRVTRYGTEFRAAAQMKERAWSGLSWDSFGVRAHRPLTPIH